MVENQVPEKWKYPKDHGLDYPVEYGDLWSVGDRYLVGCGDLAVGASREILKASGAFGVVPTASYVDPPWNAGNAAAFRTKAGVPGSVEFGGFLRGLYSDLLVVGSTFVSEMGRKLTPTALSILEELGAAEARTFDITYYRRHPSVLIVVSPTWEAGNDDPTGLDDDDTPDWFLRNWKPEAIYDPCGGRGLTLNTAAKHGIPGVSLELHPNRVSSALAKLEAITGLTPVKHPGSLPHEATT